MAKRQPAAPPPTEEKWLEKSEYLDTRKLLQECEGRAAERFDKFLLTVSSGGLGLSLTFVREIGGEDASCRALVGFSWLFFGLAIVAILGSLLVSQKVFRRQVEIWDVMYHSDGTVQEKNEFQGYTTQLNYVAMGCFVLGVIFVAVFALTNL